MRIHALPILAIVFLMSAVTAAESSPRPAQDAKPEPKVWQIARFLSGTSSQVRDKLNGESERFMAKSRMMQKMIVELDKQIILEEKESVERAKKSEEYLKVQTELRKAEAQYSKVRETGTPYEKVELAGKVNTLKLMLARIEKMAPQGSPELKKLKQERGQRQDTVAKYELALKESLKWRAEIIDAMRNVFRIHGPVKVGSSGILGIVTPARVIDQQNILIIYRAHEPISIEDTKEGIATVNVLVKEVPFLVTGIDTKGIKPDTPVLLDKNFVLTDAKIVGDELVYIASRKKADVDDLFEAIVGLREIELHQDIDPPATLPTAATTQASKR